jgi:ribosomal protein S19
MKTSKQSDQQSKSSEKKTKTWKREVAVLLLIGLGYVVYIGDHEMAGIIVWPIMGFAAGAFGLDSFSKQLRR